MPQYENSVIYKLVHKEDLDNNNIYIGSTTNFRGRKAEHKKAVINDNDKNYNCKKYQYIRENGGWDNWTMIQIEKYPCNDRRTLEARERYWAEQHHNKLINTNRICITEDEKIYVRDNSKRDRTNERKLYICECGEMITNANIKAHLQTEKHLNLLNNTFKTDLITCECGCKITKYNLERHLLSNKHKKNLSNR